MSHKSREELWEWRKEIGRVGDKGKQWKRRI